MAEVKAPALSPNLLKLAEYERNVFVIAIPPGVPLKSVLRPDFWTHVAKQLKPYARIECRAQDNKWIADLMVASVGNQMATMWLLNYVDLEAQGKDDEPVAEYTVSFAPRQRWRVIRTSDNTVVHKDEATEESARAWIAQQTA